ncbi:zinc ABC transporter substrate-binding protein [Breoghania sp.]|uniref:zinc ABC transporter substrate-binding protein n=1 Tax=Breoghania sp. TaxID=2065378 RepID=UPI002AA5F7A3|nr:zinc ABC transporter substrate-binding protein [Breoghania sp.]
MPLQQAGLRAMAAGLFLGLATATFPIAHAQTNTESGEAGAVPDVVVSIQPVHSLVAGVMGDLGTPTLLVRGGASPHSYALKPSDARALDKADIIFRIGESLEAFLNHPLETLGEKAVVVDLGEGEGVHTLAFREGALWEAHEHGDEAHDDHGHEAHEHEDHAKHDEAHAGHEHAHDHHGADPHVWLDPANARVMVDAIAATLIASDPAHKATYETNAAKLNGRLAALEEKIDAELLPVRGRPFIVFHDGYHYFEHRFEVEAVGAVAVNPEQQPGAARISEIRDRIVQTAAVCVFTEPQFRPRLVNTLLEGTSARAGVLDPLGADIEPGPEAYETMMQALADGIRNCLAGE